MDWFILVMAIIFGILLLIASVYILAIYCHSDDQGFGQSLWCKILVVTGLFFSWSQLLILPLDIANSRGKGGDLNMDVCWQIIYYSIIGLLAVLLPQAIFYYESDEDKTIISRFIESIVCEFIFALFIGLILFISYYFWHFGDLPMVKMEKSLDFLTDSFVIVDIQEFKNEEQKKINIEVEYEVYFNTYLMAILAFFGYFLFVIFGGVGLSTLPLDLIQQFRHRPKKISKLDAMSLKSTFQKRTNQLIQLGEQINEAEKEASATSQGWWAKRRTKAKFQRDLKVFNAGVAQLGEEYDIFKLQLNIVDVNPIVFYMKLIAGILGIFISLLWWVHVLICMVITVDGFPLYTFLNKTLIFLEDWNATFVSTGILAVFSIYLLWCVAKGNFKVGVRIPFLMTIHPMVPNETWMNAFLFNIALILICSVSVSHFISTAFS